MTINSESEFYGGTDQYSLVDGINPISTKIQQTFQRRSMRADKELLTELIGVAAGATALATEGQIDAPTDGDVGGLRTVNTVDLVNRVTASADVTALTDFLSFTTNPNPYVADLSGNGSQGA